MLGKLPEGQAGQKVEARTYVWTAGADLLEKAPWECVFPPPSGHRANWLPLASLTPARGRPATTLCTPSPQLCPLHEGEAPPLVDAVLLDPSAGVRS